MNIIITGCSRGIGYETALAFSEVKDARLVLISRNRIRLEELTGRIQIAGKEALPLPFDLVEGDYQWLRNRIEDFMPAVDLLINNAGGIINKPVGQLTEADFDYLFSINIKSVFRIVKLLMPVFAKNGHVVNISSMGGFQGSSKFPGLSLYSASKGALATFSECLAEELKPLEVKVNCLAIGSVQTEMLAEAFPGYEAPVKPDQMGRFIRDFSLEGSKFFNGKVLPVALTTP